MCKGRQIWVARLEISKGGVEIKERFPRALNSGRGYEGRRLSNTASRYSFKKKLRILTNVGVALLAPIALHHKLLNAVITMAGTIISSNLKPVDAPHHLVPVSQSQPAKSASPC